MSDNELGAFLRSRREAISPADVGLPAGFRRRTPGLRRSELATLTGISVEYLARLEQGRDRRPSPQVLGALADTLRPSGAATWLASRSCTYCWSRSLAASLLSSGRRAWRSACHCATEAR